MGSGTDETFVRRAAALDPPRRRMLVVLMVASLLLVPFWAATVYATSRGRAAALADDMSPERLPLVTIFSPDFLDRPGSAVRGEQFERPEPHYRFSRLRLLTYTNDRWFLVTGRYDSHHVSTVTVLRDSESLRVEIAEDGTRAPAESAAE